MSEQLRLFAVAVPDQARRRAMATWYRTVYLGSAHWLETRARQLRLVGWCQTCGSTVELQVHHLHYSSLWAERTEDLCTLCARCHRRIHARANN
jgi:5-methylcytosine-specific restriction endonuclease McrA